MALLELDGLTRRFGGIVAVDHVTMRVEAGEVRAVIGPNGAGKSTLFNLITGVVKPTEGTVRFDDETLTGLPPLRHLPARHVAHLPVDLAVSRDDGARERATGGAGAACAALAALWRRRGVRRRGSGAAMRRWNGWV